MWHCVYAILVHYEGIVVYVDCDYFVEVTEISYCLLLV
jgi:hypothetical protein